MAACISKCAKMHPVHSKDISDPPSNFKERLLGLSFGLGLKDPQLQKCQLKFISTHAPGRVSSVLPFFPEIYNGPSKHEQKLTVTLCSPGVIGPQRRRSGYKLPVSAATRSNFHWFQIQEINRNCCVEKVWALGIQNGVLSGYQLYV